jgi:hypothetical protein
MASLKIKYLVIDSQDLTRKITKNNIKPLLEFMANNELCMQSKNFVYEDIQELFPDDDTEVTIQAALEYLDSIDVSAMDKTKWTQLKQESKANLIFIHSYIFKKMLNDTTCTIMYLNLNYYYGNKTWTQKTRPAGFLEWHLASGGNVLFTPSGVTYHYTEKPIATFLITGAVKSFGEFLEATYYVKISKTAEADGTSVMNPIKCVETLQKIAGKGGFDHLQTILDTIKRSHKINKEQFWHGTAPFCNGNPGDCEKIGGKFYRSVPDNEITSKDKENYGSSCWTGRKVLCRYDPQAAINSGIFEQAGLDPDKFNFELKWFGTAPFCGVNSCDVWADGFMPLLTDDYGDGSYCVTGNKILGVRPLSMTEEQKKNFNNYKQKCQETLTMEAENKAKMWNTVLDVGTTIVENL